MSPWVLFNNHQRLTNFLLTGYNIAIEVYFKNPPGPISSGNLEKIVLSVALACYDGASNGNKTRGGLLKTSEM